MVGAYREDGRSTAKEYGPDIRRIERVDGGSAEISLLDDEESAHASAFRLQVVDEAEIVLHGEGDEESAGIEVIDGE
jgi:hypothetical protein